MFCDFPKYKHLKQTIYRGPGGGGNADSDAEINALAAITNEALAYSEAAGLEADAAAASAAAASTSAAGAATSASGAATSATNAASSASSASTSASSASTSATNAAASASSASTSATNAASSASAASTSATNAASSATAAASSATTATTQAGIATTGAGTATTQASNAATSASAAAGSATTASTQASNAATSASGAATSATNASNSASAASTSAANALASETAAAASVASIDLPTIVRTTGNQTIGGIKTFSSTIVGSISGNAATATTATNQSGGTVSATSIAYSTTLTGGTGVVNLGSGQVYKDASGNVGIGTTAPGTKLDVVGGISATSSISTKGTLIANPTGYNIYIRNVSGTNRLDSYNDPITATVPFQINASQQAFYIADAEKMRIDSSGNVGVGTTSPVAKLAVVGGTSNASSLATAYSLAAFNITPKSSSGYSLQFGSGPGDVPYIQMSAGGAAAGDMTLQPYGGNLLVGGTTVRDNAKITNEFSSQVGSSFYCVTNTNAVDFLIFRANAGTLCGAISRVGTTGAVVYTATSDYRLKENIAPISGALAKVSTLNPVTFTWKDGGGNADGFIAHEFAEVCPNGVIGEKDGVDENGDPKYQAMDSSVAIPFLAAAIKELKALADTQASTITALTARITALESI